MDIEEVMKIKLDYIDRAALAISEPGEEGELYRVFDYNAETLSDLFAHAGVKIKKLSKKCLEVITGSNEDEENKKEFDKYAMFKLCEFLATKGYAIMVREAPSKEQGADYYNVRLYISNAYLEDNQEYFARGTCYSLDLTGLSEEEIKKNEHLKNLKFKVFMVDKDKNNVNNVNIVKESAFDENEKYRIINAINVEDDEIKVISPNCDIYSYPNPGADNGKGLLTLISYSSIDLEHLKHTMINNYYELAQKLAENGFITLDYLHMTGYTNENKKLIYLPKDINKNEMQMKILEILLIEFQMMQIKEQRGELREDFTLNIYIGKQLFKRFRNESFHWDGEFTPKQIISDLNVYIEQMGQYR